MNRLFSRLSISALVALFWSSLLLAGTLPEFASNADRLIHIKTTSPLGFDAYHVQGIAVTEDYYFLSCVLIFKAEAYVFKVDRKTLEKVDEAEISDFHNYHAGGLDFDGKYLWVPVAVYKDYSHTNMMVLRPEDLKFRKVFEVDDHIGAVAILGDKIIGANWSARQFYFWTRNGEQLDYRESPTGVGYQDCKGVDGFLVCTGGGYMDWIDVEKWELAKRFVLENSAEGNSLSREGGAVYGEKAYFLPDDGFAARVYEYGFSAKK